MSDLTEMRKARDLKYSRGEHKEAQRDRRGEERDRNCLESCESRWPARCWVMCRILAIMGQLAKLDRCSKSFIVNVGRNENVDRGVVVN